MGQGCGHQTGIAFTGRTEAMTSQHHTSIAKRILGSTQRIFRSTHSDNLLAPAHIDARTARDIGINLVGLH
jgi:predicted metalloprotease with PDZ domain